MSSFDSSSSASEPLDDDISASTTPPPVVFVSSPALKEETRRTRRAKRKRVSTLPSTIDIKDLPNAEPVWSPITPRPPPLYPPRLLLFHHRFIFLQIDILLLDGEWRLIWRTKHHIICRLPSLQPGQEDDVVCIPRVRIISPERQTKPSSAK